MIKVSDTTEIAVQKSVDFHKKIWYNFVVYAALPLQDRENITGGM